MHTTPDRSVDDLCARVPSFAGVPRAELAYLCFAATFAVVLVLTNLIGVKLFVLFPRGRPFWFPGSGPMTLTSGILTYPLTFLLTDIVSEIWGHRRANFMVLLGFAMSMLMLAVIVMARALPPSPFWQVPQMGMGSQQLETAFHATFYFPGLLLFASMLAYLVAQLIDVRLYHFWWKVTAGRHMWVRNNGSTMISQLVDTTIVNGIYLHFGLRFDWPTVWSVILSVYIVKFFFALSDTPLIYLGRSVMRAYLDLPSESAPQRAPLAPS